MEQAEANAAALSPLSADGRIGTITWTFEVRTVTDVEPETQDAVLAAVESARGSGLTAEVNGAGMQSFAPPGGTSELIGIAIAANRNPACRCALVSEPLSAQFARTHNDANAIALGARMIGEEMAKACVEAFLSHEFEGGRHAARVDKLSAKEPV